MKFGLVMSAYVGDPARSGITARCLSGLAKTVADEKPTLLIMIRFNEFFDYNPFLEELRKKFNVVVLDDIPGDVNSRDVYMADLLFSQYDATHVVFLYSDFVFNSQWLSELKNLILRHPSAKAWSVYRSSYTRHHKIVGGDGVDVLMTMHDGLGCLSKEEWNDYRELINGDYTCPDSMGGGSTIDIHHPYKRPGEYWATGKDYWENIGVHSWLGRQDQAIDFVGED